MGKRPKFLDEKIFINKRAYLLQSLLAAAYILLIFLLLDALREGWAIAPLAASTFIAFTFPKAVSSSPRYLVGGYFVAGVVGALFSLALAQCRVWQIPHAQVWCCALAMLCAMLLMVALDFEHPPAAALAITLVLSDEPVLIALTAFACICVLSGGKQFLLRRLHNL